MTSIAATLEQYFRTKSSADVDGTMSFFSPDLVCYVDATLGWDLASFGDLEQVFRQYMPTWPTTGRSYTTRVLANDDSALVYMTDTPELFGGELRILAALDFVDGKVVRWLDYWDSTAFDEELYTQMRTPDDAFPTDLRDDQVATRAAPELVTVATGLQRALGAADASAAAGFLHTDVVLEDMALRTQVVGRIEATRYLDRALGRLPYGRSSRLRHVVGGRAGGGFEWTAGPECGALVGISALELDPDGLVTRVTSVYDSRQLAVDHRTALVSAAAAG